MDGKSRYRVENGEPCVDVKVETVARLYDNRDPAPFHDRDLDPDLVDYLLDVGDDLIGEPRIRVVFWLEKPCQPNELEQAYRAHFDDVITRIRRTRKRRRRTGQVALALALVLVVALVSLSQLVGTMFSGNLGVGLKEGLVISAWVVMWRPVEILIYDWIPTRHERKVAEKMLAAAIDVRVEPSKGSATVPPGPDPEAR